jgi:hypothetical protein
MSVNVAVWIVLILALIGANLPWLSDRILFVYTPKSGGKPVWIRLLEWLLMYFVVGLIALGLEQKLHGKPHSQDWEFYAVNLFLFLVFALPGFIYRYDLKSVLNK